jgi:phenylalanyl-tRNA synthetase beta chain
MKVSQNWLKKFVEFDLPPERLSDELSMLGLEIESYEDLSKKYEKFVVGEILSKEKHPKADRLSFCKVNAGDSILDIVCGAPNVAAGQKVAVALIGAVVPYNQHDPEGKPFVIERAKIRGLESFGMICSQVELELGTDASGILVLDAAAKTGTPLAEYLGKNDVIYEIGITPNRADCLSHIGVAREIGILVDKKIRIPDATFSESEHPAHEAVSIKIEDAKRCPRYSARVVRNVKIAPSPKWLQDLLSSIGIRPINNVVDVSNLVLMETGHPLHTFDYGTLAGHAIVVRTAKEGERFTTLDGKERILPSETLMICDAEKFIAVAGVMGGANTEISNSTVDVLIEGAYFDPSSIRRTSKHLGLSTEASYRFERGTDIGMCAAAVNRAAQLIQELAGGEILCGVLDAYPGRHESLIVRARVSRINSVIGIDLTKERIAALLQKIGLLVQFISDDEIAVTVPSYRNDLFEEVDIIEEAARVFGYNNIETKTHASIDFTASVRTDFFEDRLREYLIGTGCHEILTIGLYDEETAMLADAKPIKVINAVSAEMEALRTSLIPGALKVAAHNRNHGIKDLQIFEIGNVFSKLPDAAPRDLSAYKEEQRLFMLFSGAAMPLSYSVPQRKFDFLDIKGQVAALLEKFVLDNYRFIYYDTGNSLTEQGIRVEINGAYAGFFGELKKQTTAKLDIDDAVYACELSVEAIRSNWITKRQFSPLPKFPGVTRDVAFTVEAALPQKEVEEVLHEAGGALLKKVALFDVYIGEQLVAGKKSLAYALEFQSSDRTLKDDEIDEALAAVIQAVQLRCHGTLRS